MVEHHVRNVGVGSSNLLRSTFRATREMCPGVAPREAGQPRSTFYVLQSSPFRWRRGDLTPLSSLVPVRGRAPSNDREPAHNWRASVPVSRPGVRAPRLQQIQGSSIRCGRRRENSRIHRFGHNRYSPFTIFLCVLRVFARAISESDSQTDSCCFQIWVGS